METDVLTPPTETPVAPPADPKDDLWTVAPPGEADAVPEKVELAASEVEESSGLETKTQPDIAEGDTAERDAKTGQFAPKKEKKSPRDNPYERVKTATAEAARAKDEARQLRERLAALEAAQAAPKVESTPEPKREATVPGEAFPKFEAWIEQQPDKSYEDYLEARQDWRDDRRWEARQAQAREMSVHQAHAARMTEALAADVTLKDALAAGDRALAEAGVKEFPPALKAAILQSDASPAILRWLGAHPEQAITLVSRTQSATLDAVPLVRELLESKAAGAVARPDSAPPTVRPSAAKPPINRVGGTASATPVSDEDLDFGPEYVKAVAKKLR